MRHISAGLPHLLEHISDYFDTASIKMVHSVGRSLRSLHEVCRNEQLLHQHYKL